ncbi:hypothetical protein LY78DRAFT_723837 [Colletotrichum sublineola]|nr:hypothetical protein LY78DRAFT_723837 [Colletotrichum sublineola]
MRGHWNAGTYRLSIVQRFRHSASLVVAKPSHLCLACFVRPVDVFLPCECALCETCYRGYGDGGINALSIGVLESSLDTCEKNFLQLAPKLFPKASTKLGRWYQKLSQCVRLVFKDSIYSPSGPILNSITGRTRLQGPQTSLYKRKPYDQMKVAVTSIESKTSMSKLFTTYTGHDNRLAEFSRSGPLLVQEA